MSANLFFLKWATPVSQFIFFEMSNPCQLIYFFWNEQSLSANLFFILYFRIKIGIQDEKEKEKKEEKVKKKSKWEVDNSTPIMDKNIKKKN